MSSSLIFIESPIETQGYIKKGNKGIDNGFHYLLRARQKDIDCSDFWFSDWIHQQSIS